ncbi:L,D-transpeptidase family protein [Nigerium massiliense]|uniref:L,D-transpeptidase family protein n=1 Tax=Nigerium massiliense TaxID=1522317 RepID=UPI00058E38E2|nr:L,D-transpeptidase family protein [Nigerium massiliense]
MHRIAAGAGVSALTLTTLLAIPATAAPTASSPAPVSGAASCSSVKVGYGSSGTCAKEAQALLKKRGYLSGAVDGRFGTASVNATLNYQRAHGIKDDGVVGGATWTALAAGKPRIAAPLPASCKVKGTVLCASKARRTIYLLKNGVVQRAIPVRFGGFASNDKGKPPRLFPTVNGTYRVYAKDAKAFSTRWDAHMPYSVKFDPNMYVHYSGDFARNGYNKSSHGCINVGTMSEAAWIYRNTPVGSRVVVY